MDFVSALMVLQAANEKELQSHRAETISTLRQVCRRLQTPILPDDNSLSNGENGTESTSSVSANVSNRRGSPATIVSENPPDEQSRNEYPGGDNCLPERSVSSLPLSSNNITKKKKGRSGGEALLKAIIGAVRSIWSIRKENVDELISRKRSPTRDRRVEDLTLVEEDIDANTKDRLLRTSALLSYASEFELYQREHNETSKVDSVVKLILDGRTDTKSLHERKGSPIAKYIKRVPHFEGKESLISRAIGNGVKFTVVKKLLERKLKDRNLSDECHAILLVLGFPSNRLLIYRNLLELLDLLISDQALVEVPLGDSSQEDDGDASSQRHILHVIRELSPWSKMLEGRYGCTVSPASLMDKDFPQPSQKRACHSYRVDWRDLYENYGSPLSVANLRNPLPVHQPSDVHHISQTQKFNVTGKFSHGTAAEIRPLHGTHHMRSTGPFNDRPLTGSADREIPTCGVQGSDSDQQILETLNYAEGTDFDNISQRTLDNLDYAEGTDFDSIYQRTLDNLDYAEGTDFDSIYQQTFGI